MEINHDVKVIFGLCSGPGTLGFTIESMGSNDKYYIKGRTKQQLLERAAVLPEFPHCNAVTLDRLHTDWFKNPEEYGLDRINNFVLLRRR